MNFQLDARALPIALVIVAISGIVTLAFVERLSLEHDQFVRQTSVETTSLAVRSGINWLLAYGNAPAIYGESLELPHSIGRVNGRIWSFPWGTYRYLAVEVIDPINGDTIATSVLAGAYPVATPAVRLPSAGEPLRTSGTVRIGGDVEVPGRQIGNYSAPEFGFNQLELIGEKIASSTTISTPEIKETLPDWEALFASNWPADLHPIRRVELDDTNELPRLQCDQFTTLAIIAQDSLTIPPGLLPPNAIIQAPNVTFMEGAHAPIQVLCGSRTTLMEGAHLPYPSVILLSPGEELLPNAHSFVTLQRYSILEGSLLANASLGKQLPHVQLLPESKVIGEIIAAGNISLAGDVLGSVTAGSLDLRLQSGETIRNLIAGVEISPDRRPARFLTPINASSPARLDVLDIPIPSTKLCP